MQLSGYQGQLFQEPTGPVSQNLSQDYEEVRPKLGLNIEEALERVSLNQESPSDQLQRNSLNSVESPLSNSKSSDSKSQHDFVVLNDRPLN